jgi:hypothetical protein
MQNFIFFLIALGYAFGGLVKEEAAFIRWKSCSNDALLHDIDVDFTPGEPRRGKMIHADASFKLDSNIIRGDFSVVYQVKLGPITVASKEMELCAALDYVKEQYPHVEGVPSCPMYSDMKSLNIRGIIPMHLPMGKYSIHAKARRNSKPQDPDLVCIDVELQIGLF